MAHYATSLHILLPKLPTGLRLSAFARVAVDPVAAVEKAYAREGWRRAGPDETATRHVTLCKSGVRAFLSVYDSATASPGAGILPELALSLSGALRTAAIVTSLGEAGLFSFVLFHRGQQVDAAFSGARPAQQDWLSVRGQNQAAIWHAAFGRAHFAGMEAGNTGRLTNPAAAFLALAGAAATAGDAGLAAWCRLAGLPVAAARLDAGSVGAAVVARMGLVPAPKKRLATKRRLVLAFDAGAADYPYHGFYPAPWPVQASATRSFVWPLTCSGGGLRRFRLVLHIDRTGGFVVHKVSVAAYGFRHGQLTAAAPLAQFGQTVPEDEAATSADLCFDTDSFGLREPPPGIGGEYALLLRVDITAPPAGAATLTPTLRAGGADAAPLILPTLKLAVTKPHWAPVVADPLDELPARRDAVLRLNAPSVHTCVAILPDTGADIRDSLRQALEICLAPVSRTALVAAVHTITHRSAGMAEARSTQIVPMRSLMQDRLWRSLFDAASGLQTVRIGIGLADAPWPLAGFVMQTTLRDEFSAALEQSQAGGPTLAAAGWAIAEDSALSLLRLDVATARQGFAAWVRHAAPLQAWTADCAWVPDFDRYGCYTLTPYEAAADIDWYGRGLAGTLTDRAWLRRRLRYVAPRMWLGWEMAELVDATTLTGFAKVMEMEDGLEITLHNHRDLARLEKALLPLLPLKV